MSKKILLTDCDCQFVKPTTASLAADGFEVITADNVKTADELIARNDFNAAIVCLKLDHADSGFTLAYHLKQKNPATPVIMVSDVEFDSLTEEERSWTKADAILVKPVRYEQIKTVMQKLNLISSGH
ncbi:MAG: response regulator [Sedimentisphaerales bacterium]|nr:response regulator [Sedimentisphaerales bacterium]